MEELPWAMLAKGPACTKTGVPCGSKRQFRAPGKRRDRTNLERLHQVGLDGVLHEDGEGASSSNVVAGDGDSSLALADDHLAESVAHVGKVVAEREDGHALGSDGDVEASGEGASRLGRGLSGGDLAKVAIVGVDDAVPASDGVN